MSDIIVIVSVICGTTLLIFLRRQIELLLKGCFVILCLCLLVFLLLSQPLNEYIDECIKQRPSITTEHFGWFSENRKTTHTDVSPVCKYVAYVYRYLNVDRLHNNGNYIKVIEGRKDDESEF